jgi:hypothetical protein
VEPAALATGSWLARLAAAVKRPFHQLAAYYANQAAAQQTAVNDELRRILALLAAALAEPDPRLGPLEAEIARLQQRLAALEAERPDSDA